MKLGIVSDIHGNLPALEAVVADMRRRNVDTVINLGDSLSGPLLPSETAAWLRTTDWLHLAGNHERQIIEAPHAAHPDPADVYAHSQLDADTLAWIASLRDTHAYAPDIFLCHASPRRDVEYLLETVTANGRRLAASDEIEERLDGHTETLVLCGHTHMPRSVRLGAQLIINPGSVGLQAFDDEHPYFHRVENGSPDARYAVIERGASDWTIDLISVPYDFEAMARLADEREMPDWAHALRHGRMPGA